MSNMAVSLPRGLGPIRLLVIFVILVSLLLFRSYYLPNPEGQSESSLSSIASTWKGASSNSPNDQPDVDFGDGSFDFDDSSDVATVDTPTDTELDVAEESAPEEEKDSYDSTEEDQSEEETEQEGIGQHGGQEKEPTPKPKNPNPKSKPKPKPKPDVDSGPTYASGPAAPVPPKEVPGGKGDGRIPGCRLLPGADKVVVMVKTGATEAFNRIPEQLVTLAECVPNFMIFSDMEQHIGEFHIHDALDEIGKEYKENHEDFLFYNAIHEAHNSHGDVSVLGSDKAWALDKWKNIPMLHKAYTKYPDAEWYITIDADTYLSWVNLLLLLDRMDPEDALYAGCVYWHGPTAFAQGGTGYLLSNKAVKKFEEIRTPEKIADWEKETSTICCGDVMLGVAMKQAGVYVSGAWPMFQVDPPSGYLWSERTWCTPAITWHHVHSYEVEALWQFEQDWLQKTWDDEDPGAVPYLYKDVFDDFVMPHISKEKKDWNNMSGDKTFTQPKEDHVKEESDWDWKDDEEKRKIWYELSEPERASIESVEKCRDVCESDESCVQFSWHPGTCKVSSSIKMGKPVPTKEEYVSGWMIDRVKEFKKARGKCTSEDISWQIG